MWTLFDFGTRRGRQADTGTARMIAEGYTRFYRPSSLSKAPRL